MVGGKYNALADKLAEVCILNSLPYPGDKHAVPKQK